MSLDEFFDDLGKERTAKIKAHHHGSRSEPLPRPSARRHLTLGICLDPFHLVKLGTEALEEVRKDLWREMRKLPSPVYARKFAGARWALLWNPGTLTKRQGLALLAIKQRGGALWRAWRDEGVLTGDLCW